MTHFVNVGNVDLGLIANGDGSVALYAQDVKAGKWNMNRLHWVQSLEVGGHLTAMGATLGKAVSLSAGGQLTAILHFYGKGRSGNETRSGECRYYPYPGNPISTEFYGDDVVGSHYEHCLIINRGGSYQKWFIFKDDGVAHATGWHWQNSSGRKIKNDIAKIENGLEKIETLNGCTYAFAGNRHAGVMADELVKVLPEGVGNISIYPVGDGTFLKGYQIDGLQQHIRVAD